MPHSRHKMPRPEILSISDDLNTAAPPARGESRSGSIAQHLDMIERGPLRGEEILRNHGIPPQRREHAALDERLMERNFNVDLSEPSREGDEESGDEHSSGLQGGDQGENQYDTASIQDSDCGMPGEMTEKNAHADPTQKGYRRRAS